jgi:ABC-2 type transport system permease protein
MLCCRDSLLRATPVEDMTWWLQVVTQTTPLRHMIVVMQGVFLKGMDIAPVEGEIQKLLIIAAATVPAPILLFRGRKPMRGNEPIVLPSVAR